MQLYFRHLFRLNVRPVSNKQDLTEGEHCCICFFIWPVACLTKIQISFFERHVNIKIKAIQICLKCWRDLLWLSLVSCFLNWQMLLKKNWGKHKNNLIHIRFLKMSDVLNNNKNDEQILFKDLSTAWVNAMHPYQQILIVRGIKF